MTPEARLTAAIVRRLRQYKLDGMPIWWMKIGGSALQKRGVPDLLIVLNGRAVFLEVKVPGNNATPLQLRRLDEIRNAGGVAMVCRTVEEVEAWVRVLTEEASVFDDQRQIARRRNPRANRRRGP